MLDFGTTASHSNAIEFPEADYGPFLDAMTSYSILIPIRPRAAGWTGTRVALSKYTTAGPAGWRLHTINDAGSNRVRVVHASGGTTASPGDTTTVFANGVTRILILWWDGAIFRYYVDGISEGDVAFTKAIADNGGVVSIGNQSDLALGAQIAVGPVVIWNNYALSESEVAQATAGQVLPAASNAILFHRGIAVPGVDEIIGIAPTEQGTVSLLADAVVDVFFPLSIPIPQHRHVATHRLLQSTFDDHRHTVRVPLWLALKLELLDPFNVSHDSLLRSQQQLESLLSQEDGLDPSQLFLRWTRQLVDLVAVSVDYKSREAVLTFQDMEKFISTYFCSERVVGASTDSYPGMAQSDLGGTVTVDRNTKGFIIQDSTIITASSYGTFFASVGSYFAKRNHLGLLCEDSTQNPIARSVFDNGLSYYTLTTGTGTILEHTARLFFPPTVASRSANIFRSDATNDTYLSTPALSVAAGDNYRRIAIAYADLGVGFNSSWRLQRASDSWYFNNTSGAWQSGSVWNALPNNYNGSATLMVASYFQSKKIPATTTTWTLSVGLIGVAGNVYVGYLGMHKGPLRFQPVPTFGSAVTTTADVVSDVLEVDVSDPVRQLHWAGHGTIELSMVAEQDVDDMPLSSKYALLYAQYGTSGKDYDAVLYEKPGAGAARFTYERWRDIAGTSTLDARAIKEVDIVRGTTYHIAARSIGSDQELGLTAKTMKISVNGVHGAAVVATAQHSTTEKHTEVWTGSAPTALGFSRAMNYIYDVRLQPRVITNEEVKS